LLGKDGRSQRHCARFPAWRNLLAHSLGTRVIALRAPGDFLMHDFDHESSRAVDHVIGAFYFVRRELFAELGDSAKISSFTSKTSISRCGRSGQGGPRTTWRRPRRSTEAVERLEASRPHGFTFRFGRGSFTRSSIFRCSCSCSRPGYAGRRAVPSFAAGIVRGSVPEVVDTLKGYWMLYTDLPGCIGGALGIR